MELVRGILDQRRVEFEYEGEMAADVALNPEIAAQYPFSRLTGPANVLVMPAFHSASISTKRAMAIGTAGYTSMLCVMALEKHGIKPDNGEVLVTGAAGGVGSVAVAILGKLDEEVEVNVTFKARGAGAHPAPA